MTDHLVYNLSHKEIFTLCIEGVLSLLVLGNFVGLVLLALLAVRPAGLRDVHLKNTFNFNTFEINLAAANIPH